jgi:tetratricopeptide (TPR) repeat protein
MTSSTRIVVLTILLCLFSSAALGQTGCLETATELQPQLSAETQRAFETKLNQAQESFTKDSTAENVIWLGRRTAYLGRYKDAIRIFAKGIEQFPTDARLYRHRGHRYITLRCFDAAIADLEQASKLIKGKPDEIEPDGLPNARNIPTSTLQSNIWYHLGLAYYLKRDFERALSAYREAEKVSKNPDMLVATTHWLYMTLRRLGRTKEASKTLAAIKDNLDIIENADYYKLIRVYKGQIDPANLSLELSQRSNNLSNATIGYGLGNWFLYNGQRAEAEKLFRQVTSENQWSSFGYIAAESELKHLNAIRVIRG